MTATDTQPPPFVETVDTRFLETLLGYNVRRASLSIIGVFMKRMAVYDLRAVDFSVLLLTAHNAGITSRQLCATLNVMPPNLVGMVNNLEKRGLVVRRPHPRDGRADGLHLTDSGRELMKSAEETAVNLELEAAANLTARERKTLIQLLKKIYL
ncbi:MAG: MarR family transcriptional regulator [Rhodoferax sp.]|nr:MarR family transcriptional regulator [Rhodoferax sp.]